MNLDLTTTWENMFFEWLNMWNEKIWSRKTLWYQTFVVYTFHGRNKMFYRYNEAPHLGITCHSGLSSGNSGTLLTVYFVIHSTKDEWLKQPLCYPNNAKFISFICPPYHEWPNVFCSNVVVTKSEYAPYV